MADVRERLERRNEERLAAIEKRKADKESKEQPTENVEYITSTFAKEKEEIEEQLSKRATLIEAGNKMKAVEFFDSLSDKCQKLQKFLADSAMFLPSRDIKVSQETLKALQQDINEKREEYLPKKKFAFKARKKEASTKEVRMREWSNHLTRAPSSLGPGEGKLYLIVTGMAESPPPPSPHFFSEIFFFFLKKIKSYQENSLVSPLSHPSCPLGKLFHHPCVILSGT